MALTLRCLLPLFSSNQTPGLPGKVVGTSVIMAPKRDSTTIRDEHVGMGAFLLRILWAGIDWVLPGSETVPVEDRQPVRKVAGKDRASDYFVDLYRTMERKGFRIAKRLGCFAPYRQYCTPGGGGSVKGHQLAVFAQLGWLPTYERARWTISHLCHCHWCCRLDHLVIETLVKNLQRNLCTGPTTVTLDSKTVTTCGCQLQYHLPGATEKPGLPCLAAYQGSSNTPTDDRSQYLGSYQAVLDMLKDTKFPFPASFVEYVKRDKLKEYRRLKVADPAKAQKLREAMSARSKALANQKVKTEVLFDESDQASYDPTAPAEQAVVHAVSDEEPDEFISEEG